MEEIHGRDTSLCVIETCVPRRTGLFLPMDFAGVPVRAESPRPPACATTGVQRPYVLILRDLGGFGNRDSDRGCAPGLAGQPWRRHADPVRQLERSEGSLV